MIIQDLKFHRSKELTPMQHLDLVKLLTVRHWDVTCCPSMSSRSSLMSRWSTSSSTDILNHYWSASTLHYTATRWPDTDWR